MKPVAYRWRYKQQLTDSWQFEENKGVLRAIEAQEYPDVVTSEPLYAIDFTKFKVVPLEPTEKMEESGCHKTEFGEILTEQETSTVWNLMIEAAPDIEDL